MYSSRQLQIIENLTRQFLSDKGRLPSKQELEKHLNRTKEYAPFVSPRVPLKDALSNAPYITKTLKDLLLDSNSIQELIQKLISKIERILTTSKAELESIQKRAARLLELYESTDFKTSIYNDFPGVPDEKSYNVHYDKSGVKILPSTSEELAYTHSINSYSADGTSVKLQTISTLNPLAILATGESEGAKGVSIAVSLTKAPVYVSSIYIQCAPITIEILVNNISVVVKDVTGSETFIIGDEVTSLEVRAYDTTSQVMVTIDTFQIFKAVYGTDEGFDTGVYISPKLDLGKENGRTIFSPSVYIPPNAGIVWYYSTDYGVSGPSADWTIVEKDENEVMHLWWNSLGQTGSIVNTPSTSGNLTNLASLAQLAAGASGASGASGTGVPFSILDYQDLKVQAGLGSIIFIADVNFKLYRFTTHMEIDEAGYLFEFANPTTDEGKLITNVSIVSSTFTHNEITGSTDVVSIEVPEGKHKVNIELLEDDRFLEMVNTAGYLDFSNIVDKISNKFGVEFNPRNIFNKDYLGRTPTVSIQPNTLTEVDYTTIHYMRPLDRFNSMCTLPSTVVQVENWAGSPELYSIVPISDVYTKDAAYSAIKETHTYGGSGGNWYYLDELYHSPTGATGVDVTTFIGSTGGICYGYNGSAIYDPTTGLCTGHNYEFITVNDTTDSRQDEFYYRGLDPVAIFELEWSAQPGATASIIANSYNTTDYWNCSGCVQGATFLLSRVPDAAPTVIESAGVTYGVTYSGPTGPGENGGTIHLADSPPGSATFIVNYDATASIRDHVAGTSLVMLQNLPAFPDGATAVEGLQLGISTTAFSGTTAAPEDFTLQHDVFSVISLEYLSGAGATSTLTGWTGGAEGATGGDLLAITGQTITVNTQALTLDQTLFITYDTMDLSQGYPFSLSYSYFNPVSYHFSYNYVEKEYLTATEIYGSTGMLGHFYDISYYIPATDDDGIYIKAVMQGTDLETPIIRRLRFNNE